MGGIVENVTKRHEGGWYVGKLKRHVTLVFLKQQLSENFIMSKMIFQMSSMIFASILTIVVNKLRYKQ